MCLGCTIALITSVALTFDKLEHFLEKPEQFMARFLANRKIHIRCTAGWVWAASIITTLCSSASRSVPAGCGRSYDGYLWPGHRSD